jgi:hypothetical protein
MIGIYLCFARNVPLERCAFLGMLGPQLIKEQIKRYIEDVLEETDRDLGGGRLAPSWDTARRRWKQDKGRERPGLPAPLEKLRRS